MINFKEIADFIAAEIKGCKFVGIADDGETFIEFEHEIENLKLYAAHLIKEKFSNVSKVTFIERLNIQKAKEMVDELNALLEQEENEETPTDLLQIEKF